MRHRKGFNHLGRTAPHRKAMLANMASSLIMHKRIKTTVAKAKALRSYVEPLITKSKNDTVQARRVVASYLNDKEAVKELFNEVAQKLSERSGGFRPGGYTRIIRLGNRLGDNAEVCMMELVDYNDLMLEEKTEKKGRSRRRRRGGSGSKETQEAKAEQAEAIVEEKTVEETPEVEAKTEEVENTTEEATEDTKTEESSDEEKKSE